MRSLSEFANLQSVKPVEAEVIDRGSAAGGPHLILVDLKCTER